MTRLQTAIRILKELEAEKDINPHYQVIKDHWTERLQDASERNIGFVYLAWLETTEYYKMGRSRTPKTRFLGMTQMPVDIVMLHKIPTNFMVYLERDLHERFAEKRVRGEWFKLTDDDLVYVTSIKEMQYNLDQMFGES